MAPATSETAEPVPPKMRADARRNRDKLVETAALAFAEHGVETSLEDIARRAGVGIGTLYRHFPTREHLVEVSPDEPAMSRFEYHVTQSLRKELLEILTIPEK